MIRRLLLLWLFAPALLGAAAAEAQHTAPASATAAANPGGLTAAEAQRALDVLQDPEKRAQLIETLQATMRADPDFAPLMLGDLALWVDAVKAAGVTHAGTIACSDAGRWPVQREFNRRLQQRFRELGIELSNG